jgi:F-type H+-transporting ATPase subunit gamma
MLQAVHEFIGSAGSKSDIEVEVFLTGRQGRKIYHKFGHKVVAEFEKIDLTTKIDDVLPMVQTVTKDYIEGKYDLIMAAYTDFISPLKQAPKLKQILPLADFSDAVLQSNGKQPEIKSAYGYKFEPDPKEVLDVLLPRLVEMQMYQAILESDASEHSSRMMAMRNASDSAKDIIKELQYSFNKARQSSITQEISEIVGGAAALE